MASSAPPSPALVAPAAHDNHRALGVLTLTALGVVYGDIGTSPLYALRECFNVRHGISLEPANVLGVLSLLVWSLVLIVTVKYVLFVMRADNDGEGGVLALMALAQRHKGHYQGLGILGLLGLIAAALLYGDGILTPAVSVLSAVEGLHVAIPGVQPYVVGLTVAILSGVFWVQHRGTGRIGSVFGPVMLVWFLTIAALGIDSIAQTPSVLGAMNPLHGILFLVHHSGIGFVALSAVFLALTGAEALYADLGHFGRAPIRAGWFAIVLPALLCQYFGQGALLLRDPQSVSNPFYHLAPGWALYPLVALATAATIIASQAMLSGVFSLTLQGVQLGYFPPVEIRHTSEEQSGQIYVPFLNWSMAVGTILLVLGFRTSSNLASAYGIAVAGTMVITTLLMYAVARDVWRWPAVATAAVVSGFAIVDLTFLGSNLAKVEHGGWVPIAIGCLLFTFMTTWHRGRIIVVRHIDAQFPRLTDFLTQVLDSGPTRVPGWAVYMTTRSKVTPPALIQNVRHNRVLHQHVLIVTIRTENVPHIPCEQQIQVKVLEHSIRQIFVRYGFMDRPDVPRAIRDCSTHGLRVPLNDTTFFLSRLTFIATPKPGMALWREHLFVFLARNSQRSSSYFQIPPDKAIEIGLAIEI
jgi:KUP system potassium uptake protein